MKDLETYRNYCTGCGLCGSVRNVSFVLDNKGFSQARLNEMDIPFCDSVCPASGKLWDKQSENIWGTYKNVYIGWSEDEAVRKQASSGGILTALSIYLLNQGTVNGIIQTRKATEVPYATETVISTTKEDVLCCAGSRYSISSPLMNIKQIVDKSKKYCFVGKPCDVYALKAYMLQDEELAEVIPLTMSFFCAGMPSVDAQKQLLARLKSSDEQCVDLRYRGDGWPGFATAINKDGKNYYISYNESWGKILGRDVRKTCRLCLDGIGAFADISCGDAWYLKDGNPDFSEADGRNVVFARTEKGVNLLKEAVDYDIIHLEDYKDQIDEELKLIQGYQYNRRATMKSMLCAMSLCRKPLPKYPSTILRKYSQNAGIKAQLRKFIGTIKRIEQKKI